MRDLPDVVINVAVAGSFIENEAKAKKQVDHLLYEILTRAEDYQGDQYGFSANPARVNLFTSPEIADSCWLDAIDNKSICLNAILSSRKDDENTSAYANQACSLVNMRNSATADIGSKAFITEWVCAQADLAILLWDGNEEGVCGDGWHLLQACKRKNVPSIWIDIHDPDNVYWALQSYFEPFQKSRLREYLSSILGAIEDEIEANEEKGIVFSSLWRGLYSRFMKKYKAQVKPISCDNDILAKRGGNYPFESGKTIQNHKKLNMLFYQYDSCAINISGRFNSSLYFRAVIPFIVTLFLAVGFYAETLFGYVPKLYGLNTGFLVYVAGAGFLIHAILNFYIYTLSKNSKIKAYKKRYLDSRFIAEFFRVSLHFMPFGFPITFEDQVFAGKTAKKSELYLKTRKIVRNFDCIDVEYNQKISMEILNNLELMLDDQIGYHRQTTNRYDLIAKRLAQFETAFFFIGFVFIVLRGIVQMTVAPFAEMMNASDHFKVLKDFIRAAANMLALVLPAWASYFSLKLSLCNFKGLKDDNEEMAKQLSSFKTTIADLKKQGKPSYESMYELSRDVYNLVSGNVRNWYMQMSSRNFTKL